METLWNNDKELRAPCKKKIAWEFWTGQVEIFVSHFFKKVRQLESLKKDETVNTRLE